jgi:hypothetical protein
VGHVASQHNLPCARKLDHSPTFVIRTLPSGCSRTEILSNRAAAYKPERNRKSVAAPLIGSDAPNIKVLTYVEPVNAIRNLAVRTPAARRVDGGRSASE